MHDRFNPEGQDWPNLPGILQAMRNMFDGLTGAQNIWLWNMLDLFADRVREDPEFFGKKGKECKEFDWTIDRWYLMMIKVAAYLDDEFEEVGPHCIASRGPSIKSRDSRAYISNGKSGIPIGRLMCFLRRGPPPSSKDEASHLCHFAMCGYWEHLIWESKGANRARIDCVDLAKNDNWTEDACTHEPKCEMDGWFYVRTFEFFG